MLLNAFDEFETKSIINSTFKTARDVYTK